MCGGERYIRFGREAEALASGRGWEKTEREERKSANCSGLASTFTSYLRWAARARQSRSFPGGVEKADTGNDRGAATCSDNKPAHTQLALPTNSSSVAWHGRLTARYLNTVQTLGNSIPRSRPNDLSFTHQTSCANFCSRETGFRPLPRAGPAIPSRHVGR